MMFNVGCRFARSVAVVAAAAGVSGVLAACSAGAPATSLRSLSSSPALFSSPAAGVPSSAMPATPPATGLPSSPTASALSQLAAYLAAADNADIHIKQASVLVNQQIGESAIHFTAAEVAAVKGLFWYTTAAGKAIPGGLPPELLRRVLLSYSDLESRGAAFRFLPFYNPPGGSLPVTSADGRAILQDLKHGAPAEARFATDLAAVRDLASTTPPVVQVAANSHATAEIAVRVARINSANTGCDSSGGWLATTLLPVIWQSGTFPGTKDRTDGTIDSIPFTATYQAGGGWNVMIWTC
jgi:hypothetical protein